jgi:HD-like signal output (HDOD) protein
MDKNLNNWVKYIGNQSVPVLNNSLQKLLQLSKDDKSTFKNLADIILSDTALTTRVLRVANSPYYNRNNYEHTNLRRIVLLLGFKKITEICITLSILDSLVDTKTYSHVYKITSKSFHAAIQARSIAEIYHLKDPDMVYLAALLYNIGEIAFWSLTGKTGRLISDLMNQGYLSKEQAEIRILGTTFHKLSLGLVTEWQLCDLLKSALTNPISETPEIKCIMYGYKIAEMISNNDVNINEIFNKLALETKHSSHDIAKTIIGNAETANETYYYYMKQSGTKH